MLHKRRSKLGISENERKQKWTELVLPSKTAKQIRERWKHILNPAISEKSCTLEEDINLLEKVRKFVKK
jgi:hypothetical protein